MAAVVSYVKSSLAWAWNAAAGTPRVGSPAPGGAGGAAPLPTTWRAWLKRPTVYRPLTGVAVIGAGLAAAYYMGVDVSGPWSYLAGATGLGAWGTDTVAGWADVGAATTRAIMLSSSLGATLTVAHRVGWVDVPWYLRGNEVAMAATVGSALIFMVSPGAYMAPFLSNFALALWMALLVAENLTRELEPLPAPYSPWAWLASTAGVVRPWLPAMQSGVAWSVAVATQVLGSVLPTMGMLALFSVRHAFPKALAWLALSSPALMAHARRAGVGALAPAMGVLEDATRTLLPLVTPHVGPSWVCDAAHDITDQKGAKLETTLCDVGTAEATAAAVAWFVRWSVNVLPEAARAAASATTAADTEEVVALVVPATVRSWGAWQLGPPPLADLERALDTVLDEKGVPRLLGRKAEKERYALPRLAPVVVVLWAVAAAAARKLRALTRDEHYLPAGNAAMLVAMKADGRTLYLTEEANRYLWLIAGTARAVGVYRRAVHALLLLRRSLMSGVSSNERGRAPVARRAAHALLDPNALRNHLRRSPGELKELNKHANVAALGLDPAHPLERVAYGNAAWLLVTGGAPKEWEFTYNDARLNTHEIVGWLIALHEQVSYDELVVRQDLPSESAGGAKKNTKKKIDQPVTKHGAMIAQQLQPAAGGGTEEDPIVPLKANLVRVSEPQQLAKARELLGIRTRHPIWQPDKKELLAWGRQYPAKGRPPYPWVYQDPLDALAQTDDAPLSDEDKRALLAAVRYAGQLDASFDTSPVPSDPAKVGEEWYTEATEALGVALVPAAGEGREQQEEERTVEIAPAAGRGRGRGRRAAPAVVPRGKGRGAAPAPQGKRKPAGRWRA